MPGSADAVPGHGPDPRAGDAPATAGLLPARRGADTPDRAPEPGPAGGPGDDEPCPDDDGEGGEYVPL